MGVEGESTKLLGTSIGFLVYITFVHAIDEGIDPKAIVFTKAQLECLDCYCHDMPDQLNTHLGRW